MSHQYVEVVQTHDGKTRVNKLGTLGTSMLAGHINDLLESDNKVAFVDLDGTLRGGDKRLHLLPSKEDFQSEKVDPNSLFAEFNKACGLDSPIKENIEKVNDLIREHYFIVLLTSCTAYEESIEATLKQMKDWGVEFATMVMRSEHNQRDAIEMKVDFFKDLINISESFSNALIFDDNLKTIEACSKLGMNTLIAEGGELFKHHGDKYNNVSSK